MAHIEPILSAHEIAGIVERLGKEISQAYAGKRLVLISVLNGSFMFAADLARAIDLEHVRIEFLGISSYGDEYKSSGVCEVTKDLAKPIEDEHVLIVEDIIDSGTTLTYLLEMLAVKKPRSLKVCTLLARVSTHLRVGIDFVGKVLGNDVFVVGYGLDNKGLLRNLAYIGEYHP